jgi:protein bicaudal C
MNLSRTSPSQMESLQSTNAWIESQPPDGTVAGLFNLTTSILESTPVRQRNQLSKYNDIATLLTGLGLEHHIHHFINAEIDMTVFPTLTEPDLINLGIKALGARRRILMAVQGMCANIQQEMMQQASSPPTPLRGLRFNGSAAPGDERRSSSGN